MTQSTQLMLDTSLNTFNEDPHQDMVYFPHRIRFLIPVLISAIATGIVVLLSLAFKLYKRPLSGMILAMNISHVLFYCSKLSVLFLPPHSNFHCGILSVINVFGLQSGEFWGAVFAHAFYIALKHQTTSEIPRMMKYYVIIAVIVPLINGLASLPTSFLIYSDTEKTCVHRIYFGRIDIESDLFTMIPMWIACIASAIWYKKAINKIAGLQETEAGPELYVLMIYPGILLVCWGPALIFEALLQFGLVGPNPTAFQIFNYLVNIQGFFNALVYGKSVAGAVRESCDRCLGKNVSKQTQTFIVPSIISERNERELTPGNYSLLSVQGNVISRSTY